MKNLNDITPSEIFEASDALNKVDKVLKENYKEVIKQLDKLKPLIAEATDEQIMAFGHIINYIKMMHIVDLERNEYARKTISNLEDKMIEGTE